MTDAPLPEVTLFPTAAAFRAWLEANHDTATEIWIGYYKKGVPKTAMAYAEAVEEALCFGWIDGKARRVDEEIRIQRFTPREPGGAWSALNIERFERLKAAGLVIRAGLEKRPRDGRKRVVPYRQLSDAVPDELARAIRRASPRALKALLALVPSRRKQYVRWLTSARRRETRERRIAKAITMLENGQRLI